MYNTSLNLSIKPSFCPTYHLSIHLSIYLSYLFPIWMYTSLRSLSIYFSSGERHRNSVKLMENMLAGDPELDKVINNPIILQDACQSTCLYVR